MARPKGSKNKSKVEHAKNYLDNLSKEEMATLKGQISSKINNDTKQKHQQAYNDGFQNVFTGQNTSLDRNQYTRFRRERRLDYRTLDSLYLNNGLAKRVIDLIPHEMTREWIHIDGDSDNRILGYLGNLKARERITDLITWARLYGGAIMIVGADDGRKLEDELNENNIKSIEFLHVYDRTHVDFGINDLYLNPMHPKYGQPNWYRVTPVYGQQFYVHESRIIRMDGERVPVRLQEQYDGWGVSVLENGYTDLVRLDNIFDATKSIVEDFVQTTIQIENLSDMMASGNEDLVRKRLEILDLSRHVANTILLDANETYEKKSSSVSGLEGLISMCSLKVSSTYGIPYVLLYGESPSGLQSTGQADIRMFYDNIRSEQHSILQTPLERLVYLVMLAKNSPTGGTPLDEWHIVFDPLWQESSEEVAKTRRTQAEADKIYVESGVLTPEEVAISRFGGSSYSHETILNKQIDRETYFRQSAKEPLANSETNKPESDEPGSLGLTRTHETNLTSSN